MTVRGTRPFVGSRLDGRFELIRELTAPFGARRFSALDPDGHSSVVHLLETGAFDPNRAETARVLLELTHPSIVRVLAYGVDEASGHVFVVEESVDGPRLSELMQERTQYAFLPLLKTVGDGLVHAHSVGIVHGALQPAHIIRARAGACLGGFGTGLVRWHRDQLESIEAPLRAFISPEQAAGGPAGRASDSWSFAKLISAALTGARGVPLELIRVVDAALDRDPERRPSVEQITNALLELGTSATLSLSGYEIAEERVSVRGVDALIGTAIDGKYRIVRRIGEGGMGVVYEAHAEDGSSVAVKLIRPEVTSKDGLRRFLREAESAMALESPHVVRVLRTGVDASLGRAFIVMQMLRGSDLGQLLRERGALEPNVAARIFVDASVGLAAAHAAGLIHRDIKPGNLFLHEEDNRVVVKICDFGVVKQASVTDSVSLLTRSGGLLGSPAYMSPEQAQDSSSVDERSDIWSLAMSLYESLSGKHAWAEHKNLGELMLMLYTRDVPPLRDIAPWIDPTLAAVVHKALTRDVEQRFQSASEFARALQPFAIEQELTPAAMTGVAAEARQRRAASPKRRIAAILSTSTLTVLAMLAGIWISRAKPAHDAPQTSATTAPSCDLDRCRAEHGGQPSRCRPDGACVKLETDRCKVFADERALGDPQTLWLGAMFPTSSREPYMADFGRASMRAADLARREFMSVSGGLPALTPGAPARPLGIVGCDDAEEAAFSAKHLAVDVGVPAVVGFGASREVIELANQFFVPRRVAVVAALNSSALIASIPRPPDAPTLVWRTAVASPTRVKAIAALVRDFLEPSVRKRLGSTRDVRVMLLRNDDAAGLSLSAGLFEELRFNGRSIADNARSFRERSYGETRDAGSDPELVAYAAEFQPDLCIFDALRERELNEIIDKLEASWRDVSRPVYVVPGGLEGDALTKLLARRPSIRSRIFGMTAPSKDPTNLRFTDAYNAAFGERLSPAEAPAAPYDSVYLLAYALAAAGASSPSGSDVARAFSRLVPPGKPIAVGAAHILEAFGELQRGGQIDLQGAYARMDFDLGTGESSADYAIVCVPAEAQTKTLQGIESGLVYDAALGHLRGSFECR